MNWLRKFMVGRYGSDQLSTFLLVLSIFFMILTRFSNNPILVIIGYIPLFIATYRIFSKDIRKRSMENYKFAMLISPIYSRVKKAQSRVKDLRTHRHYKCSTCKTMLRVPKGKGKILITCPKCKAQFTKTT